MSAAEVSSVFGHDRWRIMRRFVIEQGAKLRPIDDGLEAQLGLHLHNPSGSPRRGLCYSIGLAVG